MRPDTCNNGHRWESSTPDDICPECVKANLYGNGRRWKDWWFNCWWGVLSFALTRMAWVAQKYTTIRLAGRVTTVVERGRWEVAVTICDGTMPQLLTRDEVVAAETEAARSRKEMGWPK